MSQVVVVQKEKEKNLQALLQSNRAMIEGSLPKHMTPDRLLQIAVTEARKNPLLLQCTQLSFIGAIIQTAQLGLEPGAARGHSWLIPFKNKEGKYEVQFIIGYKGMIDLAYRSPRVMSVEARPVFDQDEFDYEMGITPILKHKPNKEGKGEKLTHAYVVVTLQGGVKVFDVMTVVEIEEARARSKASDSGPWKTDYVAMALKSVVRRFFKFIPSSIEMQRAITLDEAADRGEQSNGAIAEAIGFQPEEKTNPTDTFRQNLKSGEPEDNFNQSLEQGEFDKFNQVAR